MKRGLFTWTLLAGAGIPLAALAQTDPAPAVPADPNAPVEPAAPVDPAAPEATPTDPNAPVDPNATPAYPNAPAEPVAAEPAPVDAPPPTGPLNEVGPPEPEYKAELEPEVYWEGDADPHNPGDVPG